MKTLSRLSMVCAALMAATSLYAENSDIFEENFAADSVDSRTESESTKSYRFGRREVIFDDNGIHFLKDRNNFDQSFDDDESKNISPSTKYGNNYTPQPNNNQNDSQIGNSNPKKYRYFSTSLTSFDFGVVQFASQQMSVTLDDNDNFLDHRGFQLAGCFSAAGLPIINRHLGICTGVGGKIDSYYFSNKNLVLEKGSTHLLHYTDTVSHKKSKLTNTYLTVPVVIEVHAKDAWLMAGVEGNLLLWSNTKMKTTSGEKNRTHSNFYQNLFGYNLVAKIGVDCVGAYVRANLSPMFQDGKGPEVYPFSAGVSLWF